MTVGVDSAPSESLTGQWRKARRSMASGGNCVEVNINGSEVHVRDSKDPSGPALTFTTQQWVSLLAMIKGAERPV